MTLSIFLLPVIILLRLFDSLLWYEKGQNTATKKLLAIIMKVEVFLACVLYMFVILNGNENLLFFFSIRFFDKRRKTWTSLSCWLVWVHFWNCHQSMLWDRIHLVPGIDILEMRLKRSQKLDFRTSNCTKWSERNRRNMLLLATVLFIVTYTKLWNLNLTAYYFYPRVIRYFCWKADSKIANKNMFHTPDRRPSF